jgi:HK97 family phage prohead protease
MTMRRMALPTRMVTDDLDDRAVTVTCSTESLGRDDIILVSAGIELDNYRQNPVFLWQHKTEWPVARAEQIAVENGDLVARVRFPPPGVSARCDEVLGLIRAGVINGASTGFDVLEAEPLDPAKPRKGTRILRCELHEVSFVSIPALPDALITERSADEELHAMVDAALERQATAEKLATVKRGVMKRGLYTVAQLAYLLEELGWLKSSAEWEKDIEQDGSTVPAQLGEALKALGDVLIAMTGEEVAEMMAGAGIEVETGDSMELAAQPAVVRFRSVTNHVRKLNTRPPEKPKATPLPENYVRMAALFEIELKAVA